ncbi:MAG: sigma-54-dependent Fis family transcriptional regulator [Firmicutes bacterium]|nr:sigma-54-dependent Fis family transcriptional regulator [Bacillota bacterium]
MVNNYNIALYITEAISRCVEIRCADGFDENYADFDIEILREIYPYVKDSQTEVPIYTIADNVAYSLRKTRNAIRQEVAKNSRFDDFICSSKAMSRVVEEILSVAKYDCNVLITGDTGVGKEKVASIIQKNSGRKMQPYVKINCASISEKLIESELFGYEKGAFTGANAAGKKGYFEIADNGIIFLDEVGELPLDMQAKLLRVIQDGEFYRVGGTKPVKCNVRILSATNRNLLEMVETKEFRQDLYYRLNVFPIRVPNMNERRTEIPELVQYFLRKYNDKFGTSCSITKEAIAYMEECDWPGNIRELENTIQRLMISTKGDMINIFDVMNELHADVMDGVDTDFETMVDRASGTGEVALQDMVDNFEKKIIEYACDKFGSTRKAAKAIGISQTQLVRKKKKYGITTGEVSGKDEQ